MAKKKDILSAGVLDDLAKSLSEIPDLPEPIKTMERLQLALLAGVVIEKLMGKKLPLSTKDDRWEVFYVIAAARLAQAGRPVNEPGLATQFGLTRQAINHHLKHRKKK